MTLLFAQKMYNTQIEDKVNKLPKAKAIQEKIIFIKQVEKKSSNASVSISGFNSKSFLDFQTFFIIINIVISALHLFLILSKF